MTNRSIAWAPLLLSASLLGLPVAAAAPAIKPYLAAALADPARGDVAAIDARRETAAVLAFSGVKPGDKVAELIPGQGYFSKVFSKVVGPKGRVFLIWPNEYAKVAHPDPEVDRQLAADPRFKNMTVVEQPAAAFSTPEPVDLIFTAQNYHDYPDAFMGKVDPVAFDKAVFRSLKPGGVFLIVDHVAAAGTGLGDPDPLPPTAPPP